MPTNCCSYCYSPNHRINRCRSPRIEILFNRIKLYYNESIRVYGLNDRGKEFFIRRILVMFNLRELKAVMVTQLNYLASLSKQVYAGLLWGNLQRTLTVGENENPGGWIEIRHYTSDPIPEYAMDLSEEAESIQLWRTQQIPQPHFWEHREEAYHDNDEFIPFSRNLEEEFERASVSVKKYDINPYIMLNSWDEDVNESCDCVICWENVKIMDTVTLNCNHTFCAGCIKNILVSNSSNNGQKPCCALCRQTMKTFQVKDVETYNSISEHCINA